MKQIIIVGLLLFWVNDTGAQWSIQTGYNYLYNSNLISASKAYNLAHPWQTKLAKSMHNGVSMQFGRYIKISMERALYGHFVMNGDYYFLRLGEDESKKTIRDMQLNGGFEVLWNPKSLAGKLQTGPMGPRLFLLFGGGFGKRKIQAIREETFLYQSPNLSQFFIDFGIGHRTLMLGSRTVLTPLFRFYYYPGISTKYTQKAIMGTSFETKECKTWHFQIGVEFGILKKRKKQR
jgi:hypothetical protein